MSDTTKFFEFLYQLPDGRRDGRAILAALRQGLGKPPGSVPAVLKWVYPVLDLHCSPDERLQREEPFLIVASLYAHHPMRRRTPENFGATLARVRDGKKGSASLDKRFEALIQCNRRELPVLLRHAVSLIRSADEAIDYEKLCEDIGLWDDEPGAGRPVCTQASNGPPQRRWARAYWHPRTDEERSGSTAATGSSPEFE